MINPLKWLVSLSWFYPAIGAALGALYIYFIEVAWTPELVFYSYAFLLWPVLTFFFYVWIMPKWGGGHNFDKHQWLRHKNHWLWLHLMWIHILPFEMITWIAFFFSNLNRKPSVDKVFNWILFVIVFLHPLIILVMQCTKDNFRPSGVEHETTELTLQTADGTQTKTIETEFEF